ncbi:MAG: glycosyltransferase [Novosphingobium sp.]|nr:glycosyltransferase [Novosphingobium sp.]
MLDVGLCITVKNEESNIVDCLSPLEGLVSEIVVIDTGSTDRTCELLRDVLGIEAIRLELDESECFALSTVRNHGFDQLSTPWLMTLDADERVDPEEMRAVVSLNDADLPSGLFCRWDTFYGDQTIVEDYKLSFFRHHHRHVGLIHDTAQPSLRNMGEWACWLPQMSLRHRPQTERKEKEDWYDWRLQCAQRREPEWLRYQWFSGYMALRYGRIDDAVALLGQVHDARPALFPVESLNASMVLAGIKAQQHDRVAVQRILSQAAAYYDTVADDFEVRINHRMRPWLDQALDLAARGDLDEIIPYQFPY